MNTYGIIGGLTDGKGEVFTPDFEHAMMIHAKKILVFDEIPERIKISFRKLLKSMPLVERSMEVLVGSNEDRKLEKFMICWYGALDSIPDIDERGVLSAPEYIQCPKRATCSEFGKGCPPLMFSENQILSKRQTMVLELVKLENRDIADKLFISIKTVNKHIQNITTLTGLKNKKELASWAASKGVIK
jgi:DNA-binding CsgD family transcriptional regulator